MIKYLATHDEKCVGCMTCVAGCSQLYFKEYDPSKSCIQVQELGRGRYHLVVCDQECLACVKECPATAISRNKSGSLVVCKKKCVGCMTCVAVSPIGAMRWFPEHPVSFKCVACGACARTCPKGALEILTKEGAL